MLPELDRIIKVNSDYTQFCHPMIQNSSWEISTYLHFYSSMYCSLLFKHVLLVEAPVIPAALLIRGRKFPAAHEQLMKFVSLIVPSLSKVKEPVPVVTDDEVGICQAIDKCLSGVHRLQCWNHLISVAKAWLRCHIAVADEIPVYVLHLHNYFIKRQKRGI